MKTEIVVKSAFSVIGKEGSTESGSGFIQKLWEDANSNFSEVSPLAKKNPDGSLVGVWGAMSRFEMDFMPWENDFSQGKYLAGVECEENAEPPAGWVKWNIPGFRFVKIQCESPDTFRLGLNYVYENGYTLAGAVHDFTDPTTGINYMLFPVERI